MKRHRPEHLTDLGNARRLVARHGADLRYSCALGWLAWDGKRWQRDETGQVERWAKETALSIWDEARSARNPDERALLGKHASASERRGAIEAMIKLASTEPEIATTPDMFDRDAHLLTVNNGTIDLRTGERREHRREDMITRLAPVDYDPDAPRTRFARFLVEIMAGDAKMIAFLQRAVGYTITGETREQCLFFCHGNGANGKGALMRAIEKALGDYFRKTAFTTFLERRSEAIREDVADIAGARLVSAEETKGGVSRFDEGLVKTITGQDTVSARFLHQARFTYRPTYKIWLAANRKPRIVGTDDGIWRRIRLIPFDVKFTTPDTALEPTIQGPELPGVLAWMVRGAVDWYQHGLGVPAKVIEATSEYREEEDDFGRFLSDRCVIKPDAKCEATALFTAYREWAERENGREMSLTAFGRELSDRGFKKTREKTEGKLGPVLRIGITLGNTVSENTVGTQLNGESPIGGESAGLSEEPCRTLLPSFGCTRCDRRFYTDVGPVCFLCRRAAGEAA